MERKFVWLSVGVVFLGIGIAFASSRGPRNPGLMHMHRREFLAAGIAQGMAAHGDADSIGLTPDQFATRVIQYTDALMKALDNDKEDNTND